MIFSLSNDRGRQLRNGDEGVTIGAADEYSSCAGLLIIASDSSETISAGGGRCDPGHRSSKIAVHLVQPPSAIWLGLRVQQITQTSWQMPERQASRVNTRSFDPRDVAD